MPKVTTQKVTVKVTKHPREMFYEGKTTKEHMGGTVEFLNTDPVIPNPKMNERWLKKIKVDDIVGVEHNQYRVTEVTKENFTGINIKTKKEFTSEPDKLTMAIGSGYAEVLYRKGAPYGIAKTKEVTLKTVDYSINEDGTPAVEQSDVENSEPKV